MLTKTEAIVLHALKYGEQKLIVDLFTRRYGRLSVVVPLSRSPKARLRKQFFQPLTLLSIECDVRPTVQLQKLSDAMLLSPLPSLHAHPAKLAIGLFVAEFLHQALKGEQENEPLFDYVVSGIEWLDSREADFANFHLVFLMHLSRFLGFYPYLHDYASGAYFDLRAGSFCGAPPLHRDYLLPEEAQMMRLMMRMDFHNMHLFRMNRQQRGRCIEVAMLYYRLHLPDFPELRSLSVLRELFD